MSKNKTTPDPLEDFGYSLTITPHVARAQHYSTLAEAEDAARKFNLGTHLDLNARAHHDGYHQDADARVSVSFVREIEPERNGYTVIGWLA